MPDDPHRKDTDPAAQTEAPDTSTVPPSEEAAGKQIGPYHLIEKIGEGGMGEVWLAEQHEPVQRQLAVKVIKQGMDTKQVVARFEAERQALAMMDHPAIARVHDAGVTPRGRPYFAMEYVKGVPITEHCDRHKLTNKERLELFRQVCDGVQHAHQKAVIHRDLKPSNVLVTIQDDNPQPKIIDFGVAKATAQRLTDKTMHTQLGMLIGTPEYMSPEQAERTGQDVDTRTDVYSLGVMLYELLVGTLPFESKELREAGIEGIVRKIREEEPAKPSTRFMSLGDRTTESASRRRMDPASLKRELTGDLDWITMKALEKDRTRRYGSPMELSADIGRFLTDEPVLASPPSATYRAKKFIRRHKVGVGVASVGVLVLIAFAATMAIQARRIATERDAAEQAKADLESVVEFQAGMLSEVDPEQMGIWLADDFRESMEAATRARGLPEAEFQDFLESYDASMSGMNLTNTALDVIDRNILGRAVETLEDRFEGQPLIDARLRRTIGSTYRELGRYERAEPQLKQALEICRRELGADHPNTLASINSMGGLLQAQGKLEEAESYFREVLEGVRRVLGDDHPDTLRSINNMGGLLQRQGKLEEAEPYLRKALEGYRRVLGGDHPDTLMSINNMGFQLQAQGKLEEAEPYYREALEGYRRVLGDDHPDTLISINNLGLLLQAQGKLEEAEPYFREVLESARRVLGDDHPNTLISIASMGLLLQAQGKLEEAEPYFREVLESARRVLGDDHPNTLASISNMGGLLQRQGKLEEAEPYRREALEGNRRVLGGDHPDTLTSINNLGNLLQAQGKLEEAEPYYREALEGYRRVLGDDHPNTLTSIYNLGNLFQTQGKLKEAEPYFREALEGYRRVLGDDHPKTASSLVFLGMVLNGQRRYEEAEPLLRECLGIRQETLPSEHWLLANTRSVLGESVAGQGRYEEAEPLLVEAAEVLADHSEAPDERKREALERVVKLYEAWGKTDKAAEWQGKLPDKD